MYICIYLVIKPPKRYIGGQCPRLKDCRRPKNEQLAEKRSIEGNCEILRTIFQPRALSYDTPESRKGGYLFYNPPNNFSRRTHVPAYFVDFFVFIGTELSTSFLYIPHWLLQKVFFGFR